jgi:hypothetical protein
MVHDLMGSLWPEGKGVAGLNNGSVVTYRFCSVPAMKNPETSSILDSRCGPGREERPKVYFGANLNHIE